MIKEISIQISVKHFPNLNKKGAVTQRFTILGSKRDWRYLLDPRFYTKKIFDNEIKERGLVKTNYGFTFEKKIESENQIDVIYFDESISTGAYLNDYYFTIHDFVPTAFGCEYCRFNNGSITEETVQCDFFRKPTKRRKGSCKYFDQERLFKT